MRINQISSVNHNNSFKGGTNNSATIKKLENLKASISFKLSIYPASKIYSDPALTKLAERLAKIEAEIKRLKSCEI